MWHECKTLEDQRRWYAYMLSAGPLKNVKDYEKSRQFVPKPRPIALSVWLAFSRRSKYGLA